MWASGLTWHYGACTTPRLLDILILIVKSELLVDYVFVLTVLIIVAIVIILVLVVIFIRIVIVLCHVL